MTELAREASPLLAIIVTFNNARTIACCLERLAAAIALSKLDVRLVVIDNASTDETRDIITNYLASQAHRSLEFKFITNTRNRGFAAAVNQADLAGVRRLVLVNPDLYLGPDTLSVAEAGLRRHPGDAVVVQLYNVDGSVQPSAGRVPLPFRVLRRRLLRVPRGPYLNTSAQQLSAGDIEVEWAHFAFFYIGVTEWERLGGLDERYWLFVEDLDFCTRLRAMGGRVWWLPGGGASHEGQHSADGLGISIDRMTSRNLGLYLTIHRMWAQWLLHRATRGIHHRMIDRRSSA